MSTQIMLYFWGPAIKLVECNPISRWFFMALYVLWLNSRPTERCQL